MSQCGPAPPHPMMTLDKERSRLLAALTLVAAQKLGAETLCADADGTPRKWRLARVVDLAILDQPVDETAPRSINVYFIETPTGQPFRFAPDRLLYALRWLHKGEPPDLDLTLAPPFARAPEVWFNHAAMLLLGALQEADPSLRERIAAIAASVDILRLVPIHRHSSHSRNRTFQRHSGRAAERVLCPMSGR